MFRSLAAHLAAAALRTTFRHHATPRTMLLFFLALMSAALSEYYSRCQYLLNLSLFKRMSVVVPVVMWL
jgi:hypothetical protein